MPWGHSTVYACGCEFLIDLVDTECTSPVTVRIHSMGMDGLFRPSQVQGYLDTVGHRSGVDKAAQSYNRAEGVSPHRKVENVGKERHEDEHSGQKPQKAPERPELGIEEDLMALLSTEFGLDFDPHVVYRFAYDEATDTIVLKDGANQTIILTLSPAQFMALTEHLKRDGGVMSDYSA